MNEELLYLEALENVLENGDVRPERTGVGTRSLFGMQMRFDIRHRLPLLTTKKMMLPAITSELLWFIEGSGDERRLAEIRWGKPREEIKGKRTIWTDNAEADYWKDNAKAEGDLGRVYGVQWRNWQAPKVTMNAEGVTMEVKLVDQLKGLIEGIKNDPYGRRHILTAWNPGELDQMALPPCHVMSQFYVNKGELSCQLYQRSADMFLGVPFNIASYSIFTKMMAQVCGLAAGDFVYTIGDAHIYNNHVEVVEEQLDRKPMGFPTLYIDPDIKDIDAFEMGHFELMDYESHGPLRAKMAV